MNKALVLITLIFSVSLFAEHSSSNGGSSGSLKSPGGRYIAPITTYTTPSYSTTYAPTGPITYTGGSTSYPYYNNWYSTPNPWVNYYNYPYYGSGYGSSYPYYGSGYGSSYPYSGYGYGYSYPYYGTGTSISIY